MWATLLAKMVPAVLDWIRGFLSPIFGRMNENSALKGRMGDRDAQAKLLQDLRAEYFALKTSGAPEEEIQKLKGRLRVESTKLINM